MGRLTDDPGLLSNITEKEMTKKPKRKRNAKRIRPKKPDKEK
jgi:hypothetical protein